MYTQRKANVTDVEGRLRRYFNDKCRECIIVARKHMPMWLFTLTPPTNVSAVQHYKSLLTDIRSSGADGKMCT